MLHPCKAPPWLGTFPGPEGVQREVKRTKEEDEEAIWGRKETSLQQCLGLTAESMDWVVSRWPDLAPANFHEAKSTYDLAGSPKGQQL